jgi:outer membrane protein assembly factor BamB
MVFVGNQGGRLTALDARTGGVRWQARADDEISAAPTIVDEMVVVARGRQDARIASRGRGGGLGA